MANRKSKQDVISPDNVVDSAIKPSNAEKVTTNNSVIQAEQVKKANISFWQYLYNLKTQITIAFMALVIACGQYYQGNYTTRTNIAQLWETGFTDVRRDRVTVFRNHLLHKWNTDKNSEVKSLKILIDIDKMNDLTSIKADANIIGLVADELKKKQEDITDIEIIAKIREFRNAIIGCLNTMEAIKAVIESKPVLFRLGIFNTESPELRYEGFISQYTRELRPFIDEYRKSNDRPEELKAWVVLTAEQSYTGTIVFFLSILSILGLLITHWSFSNKQVQS
jgi:hypothetical protein